MALLKWKLTNKNVVEKCKPLKSSRKANVNGQIELMSHYGPFSEVKTVIKL